MTDTLDEVEEVTYVDSSPSATTTKRSKAATGTCKTCGEVLEDGRRSYCDDHKPERTAGKKNSSNRTGIGKLENGLSSFVARCLFAVTLVIAWQQLRRAQVPDRNGNLAEDMAFTDEEALAIARPISRIFASTEVGKSIGPKIVGSEDLIDAVFAGISYYKRNVEIWDNLGRTQIHEAPAHTQTERVRANGSNGQNARNQSQEPGPIPDIGPIYVPPTDSDIADYLSGG